jgi:hypothetical protein
MKNDWLSRPAFPVSYIAKPSEMAGLSMNLPHNRQGAASPREWLKHALSDLKIARLALGSDIMAEQICFHAR